MNRAEKEENPSVVWLLSPQLQTMLLSMFIIPGLVLAVSELSKTCKSRQHLINSGYINGNWGFSSRSAYLVDQSTI
jgi:hypothetical protein